MKRRFESAVLLAACVFTPALGCHDLHACGDHACERAGAGGASDGGYSGRDPGLTDGGGGRMGGAGRAGTSGGSPPQPEGGDAGARDAGSGGDGDAGEPAASAGAPDMADAGAAGAGSVCSAPFADCDESTFNGCESNLLADVKNCGACRAFCAGACLDGACQPFERLLDFMYLPKQGGIVASSTEVYALNTVPYELYRWSEAGAQTLFTDSVWFDEIALGVDRLYLVGGDEDYGLASIARSGGGITSEGITARAAAIDGTRLYAVGSDGVPYLREENSHELRVLPLPAPIPESARVLLAARDFEAALAIQEGEDDAPTYTLYYLPSGNEDEPLPWVPVYSGAGSPRQLRLGSSIYISIAPSDEWWRDTWTVEHELLQVTLDGHVRAVAAPAGLLDFERVDSNLFLSIELSETESLLRVVPLEDPSRSLDLPTSASMASLTYAEPYFYFGDNSRRVFARLRNWLYPE